MDWPCFETWLTCMKLLKAEWEVNQQEGEEEIKCCMIWQMMVHSNDSWGERDGDKILMRLLNILYMWTNCSTVAYVCSSRTADANKTALKNKTEIKRRNNLQNTWRFAPGLLAYLFACWKIRNNYSVTYNNFDHFQPARSNNHNFLHYSCLA